jgi:hypothetical protein
MGEANVIPGDFSRLRKLLLKPAAQKFDQLEQRLDSIEEKNTGAAENVSDVLPEAVRISARKGPELAISLAPVVESALDQSIARILLRVFGMQLRRSTRFSNARCQSKG